jgi:two-component system KDP operon response regulator KdpE
MAFKILLIDDDATVLELFSGHLEAAGYQTLTANDGPQGLKIFAEVQPDLVVLDLMMPGMDGWQVCEKLRATAAVPIILLSAKGDELDKLRGFRLGVDDYVTKPFSFAELTARVGAVLTRSRPNIAAHLVTSGDIVVNLDEKHVSVAGRLIELTPTEYRLLENLARHPHKTIPIETLLLDVWGPEYAGEVEHVKHYIWTLRKKLESDPGDPKHLLTDRGFGYRFE